MVDLDRLKARGRRAYELARLRVAARVAAFLVPLAALAVWAAGDRETCVCLAVLLLGVAIGGRWKSSAAGQAVHAGLVAGTGVLALALLLAATGALDPFRTTLLLSGAGFAAAAWASSRRAGGVSALVVALTASLGCVDLGTGVAVVVLAILLGSAIGALLRR